MIKQKGVLAVQGGAGPAPLGGLRVCLGGGGARGCAPTTTASMEPPSAMRTQKNLLFSSRTVKSCSDPCEAVAWIVSLCPKTIPMLETAVT